MNDVTPEIYLENARGPRPEEDRGHPFTCGKYPVYGICQVAHVDAKGQTLGTADPGVDLVKIRQHLEKEECAICQRWYRNAFNMYKRLKEKVPVAPDVAYQPQPRELHWSGHAADDGPSALLAKLNPVPDSQLLDALRLRIHWIKAPVTEGGREECWWLTLKAVAKGKKRRENDERDLKALANHSVEVVCHLSSREEPVRVTTRLRLDREKNLLSARKPLPADVHPEQIEKVTLLLLDKARNIDGAR
jgi:hypothetical protein